MKKYISINNTLQVIESKKTDEEFAKEAKRYGFEIITKKQYEDTVNQEKKDDDATLYS